jgi:hypothetical protein
MRAHQNSRVETNQAILVMICGQQQMVRKVRNGNAYFLMPTV